MRTIVVKCESRGGWIPPPNDNGGCPGLRRPRRSASANTAGSRFTARQRHHPSSRRDGEITDGQVLLGRPADRRLHRRVAPQQLHYRGRHQSAGPVQQFTFSLNIGRTTGRERARRLAAPAGDRISCRGGDCGAAQRVRRMRICTAPARPGRDRRRGCTDHWSGSAAQRLSPVEAARLRGAAEPLATRSQLVGAPGSNQFSPGKRENPRSRVATRALWLIATAARYASGTRLPLI